MDIIISSLGQSIMDFNDWLNSTIVWGPPNIILLMGAGILLTLITGFIVFRKFGYIFRNTFLKIFEKQDAVEGSITPFQAVSTALAATVGTGNIAGVATAIVSGGPGAVFWMWLAALIGMSTKFSEVVLSIAYREKNENNEWIGGPMYYIRNGLGWKWLAALFAIFGALASFGIGSATQSNSIASSMNQSFGIPNYITGIVLVVFAAIILIGGIKRIAQFAEKIVPFMALAYILGGLVILVINAGKIPEAFGMIFKTAFNFKAAGGGFLGFGIMQAIRFGVARGVFTNEAGLGSAPIAHAAAHTDHPVRQGMWGAFEVFIDTIMICSITALVILVSGIPQNNVDKLDGAALTTAAFEAGLGNGGYIVTLGLLLFAFTTILGWCYYGEKCMEFLLGSKLILPYRVVFIATIFLGTVGGLESIWAISDTLNGLMAIPNLIGLIALSGVVAKLVKDFFKDPDRIRQSEMEYESLVNHRNR